MKQKLKIFLVLLISAMMLSIAWPASAAEYRGIDVSEWQGDIDFNQVRNSGIEMVYIRAGFGTDYTDRWYEQNYDKAKNAGLKIGMYHYVTARNVTEARAQARFFVSLLAGKSYDCRPAMDFESLAGLSSQAANDIAQAYLSVLKNSIGYVPMVYSDVYNIENVWYASLRIYPLWAAEYGADEPRSTGHWDTWAGFQYSDAGRVPGISGNVDLDRFTDAVLVNAQEAPTPDGSGTGCAGYVVRRGDTLWGIAKRYGTTVRKLTEYNRLTNPNLIYPGEVIELPCVRQAADVEYTIRWGDTLWSIAQRYHTTVAQIVSANRIQNPDRIYAGEKIIIPET